MPGERIHLANLLRRKIARGRAEPEPDDRASKRAPESKYVMIVSSSDGYGPSGAGRHAETPGNMRRDSGIELVIPTLGAGGTL